MLVNRRRLRIEWGQCDPAGIVFYPQYFIIFDSSTGWLFERTGLSPREMREKYGIVWDACGGGRSALCGALTLRRRNRCGKRGGRMAAKHLYGTPPSAEGRQACARRL